MVVEWLKLKWKQRVKVNTSSIISSLSDWDWYKGSEFLTMKFKLKNNYRLNCQKGWQIELFQSNMNQIRFAFRVWSCAGSTRRWLVNVN